MDAQARRGTSAISWVACVVAALVGGSPAASAATIGAPRTSLKVEGNLRAGPGLKRTRLRVVPPGTNVRLLERRKSWIEVELADGTRGWLYDEVLLEPDKLPHVA